MKPRMRRGLILAFAILLVDQAAKWLVMEHLPLHGETPVIPGFFSLVHVVNKGSAFGFLNRGDIQWQRYFFIVVSLLAIGLIIHLLSKASERDRWLALGLSLVLGGAAGNLVDRIRFGHVVDFLDFYVAGFHWPAFNVADSAITLGALAIILSFYRGREKDRKA